MKTKKIPLRKCLGCSEGKPKRELIRIVKNKDGDIFVDPTGKANGRGAYICKSIDCLEKAVKTKRLSKALEIEIPDKIYDDLSKEIK
ncbi:YlxR family protein [Proteiniborus sp. MB09-C3]|uniref:RNase P modulator RnpM n=1 Tax=Proteiniborus sp. MB09-C3 TaxID=3050072 RepID=UPI0025522F9F|nr:YlxR family protein [Proteiniborus sp. MB09-C3]WIV10900.1 YlxR family protein [Proteiniborus sp. MB09-C3]